MDLKLLLVFAVTFTACNASSAQGKRVLRFCGVGYDIIKGNPDGSTQGSPTMTDPGIKTTREVVRCSYSDGSAIKVPRSSCKEVENMYEDTKSYYEKLMNEVNVDAQGSYYGFSFTASAGYKTAEEQTTKSKSLIFERTKVCYLGTVRYKLELAQAMKFKLSNAFVSAVCALPSSYNSGTKNQYMNLFHNWGTHVITQLELGTKNISRKKTTSESVLSFAEKHYSGAIGVSYDGAAVSGEININVAGMKSNNAFKSLFKSSVTNYEIGTAALPEPIELTLKEMTEFLTPKFWQNLHELRNKGICSNSFNRHYVHNNLKRALNEYPQWLRVSGPRADGVRVPLRWPKGRYGLIMPTLECVKRGAVKKHNIISSCPENSWETGWRKHDTEDSNGPATKWLTKNNCMKGSVSRSEFTWYFCLQHDRTGLYRREWPAGSYCLFKVGNTCPKGFKEGMLRYDDEDSNNSNKRGGHLPTGYYGPDHSTKYYFCCRNDELTTKKILLPVDRPFYLLAINRHCQRVHGMKVHHEEFYSDDEDSNNGNGRTGLFPYTYGYTVNTRLIMCYYRKA